MTSYTGYGTNAENPGDHKSLMRHLVCVDRKRGEVEWTTDIRANSPEANYGAR